MHKSTDYEHEQLSYINFNMACGMQLNMNNEWIRIAQQLPWKAWEALYVAIFRQIQEMSQNRAGWFSVP